MESTAGLPSPTVLPSPQTLHYSLLSENRGWSRSSSPDWQQNRARHVPWSKSSPGVRSYSGVQRSRTCADVPSQPKVGKAKEMYYLVLILPDWGQLESTVVAAMAAAIQMATALGPTAVAMGHPTRQPTRCRSAPFAFKRHLENTDQEPSSKHFLSEDKMAARFNSLSLDNDHVYSSNGFPIHDEDPMWRQAYAQLKELQQRLSQDGGSEETSSADDYDSSNVIVDGEFIMANCPVLTYPSLLQEGFGKIGVLPEEIFLSLNPCTEVVLWSPSSSLRTIRTLMALPSPASSSPQQDVAVEQEEMEA